MGKTKLKTRNNIPGKDFGSWLFDICFYHVFQKARFVGFFCWQESHLASYIKHWGRFGFICHHSHKCHGSATANPFSRESGKEMLWGRSVQLVKHMQDPQSLRKMNEYEKKSLTLHQNEGLQLDRRKPQLVSLIKNFNPIVNNKC